MTDSPTSAATHPLDLAGLLPAVRRIARAAGAAILAVYGRDIAVTAKADQSPLTEADRRAHDCILEGLSALAPDLPVWSEESAQAEVAGHQAWRRFWLVDPLDGTREFISRNGEFTVNIALVENHEPVLGVVHAPALDREYYGARGLGAWRVDDGGEPRPVQVRIPAAERVRVAGSRSHRGSSLDGFLARLGPHELVPLGSSLKMCLVAEGAADVYPRLGPTSAWDTAAAQAVVEAAGGRLVDLEGRPLRYNTGPEVLNPHFVAYGDPGRNWLELLRTGS
jgi:3'(2'), 5'-bisphosphate nucleotidase